MERHVTTPSKEASKAAQRIVQRFKMVSGYHEVRMIIDLETNVALYRSALERINDIVEEETQEHDIKCKCKYCNIKQFVKIALDNN